MSLGARAVLRPLLIVRLFINGTRTLSREGAVPRCHWSRIVRQQIDWRRPFNTTRRCQSCQQSCLHMLRLQKKIFCLTIGQVVHWKVQRLAAPILLIAKLIECPV